MNILKVDGIVYKLCYGLFFLMFSNLLWIIFSLPIITIGASTTALFDIINRYKEDKELHVFMDFIKSFKVSFKQATIAWLVLLLGIVMGSLNIYLSKFVGTIGIVIILIQIAVFIQIGMLIIYSFLILSKYKMTFGKLLKTSFILGNKHAPTSFLCAAGISMMLFINSKIPGLIMFIFFSSCALIITSLSKPVFKRYEYQSQEIGY